jgi:hypothetical protein
LPDDPKDSLALWPVSSSKRAAISRIGAVKLAATATETSPARAKRATAKSRQKATWRTIRHFMWISV